MRKIFLWMLAAILTLCGTALFTSCHDDDDNSNNSSTNTDIEELREIEWKKCAQPTFFLNEAFEYEDEDFVAALRYRFPNQVSSMKQAEVAFVTPNWMMKHIPELSEFYDRGGLIVMMRPKESLKNLIDNLPDDLNDLFFSDNEQMEELFYAYSNGNRYYTLYDEPEFDGEYDDEVTEMSDEEWKAIEEKSKASAQDPEDDEDDELYDNDTDHNENYFQTRLSPFMNFVEVVSQKTRLMSTRGEDASEKKLDMDRDGIWFEKSIPITLNHVIEKDYRWNKSSSVNVKLWVSSAYMLKSNGQNKSGDYYLVRSEVTPHIKPLWEVASKPYGWCRCRIYAYWLDKMYVKYELLGANGQDISNNVKYYKRPLPDTENAETTQSNGFTWGINGSLSGEVGKEGSKVSGNIGFSLEWSDETSFTYKALDFSRDSRTVAPEYTYFTNVTLTDADYEDEVRTNGNFPTITHTEFTVTSAWIWYVPRNTSLGVDENAEGSFKIRMSVKPTYASWYHWRWALEYNSNKKTYNGYTLGDDGWYVHTETIPAPDRTPWGVVALKNAASAYTVGNITIYRQDEFAAKGTKAPVVGTIPSSYNVNEVAKKYLAEGTYALTYQAIDPNQNNKVLGNWKYENIVIKQGANEQEATTEISTINAKKIK